MNIVSVYTSIDVFFQSEVLYFSLELMQNVLKCADVYFSKWLILFASLCITEICRCPSMEENLELVYVFLQEFTFFCLSRFLFTFLWRHNNYGHLPGLCWRQQNVRVVLDWRWETWIFLFSMIDCTFLVLLFQEIKNVLLLNYLLVITHLAPCMVYLCTHTHRYLWFVGTKFESSLVGTILSRGSSGLSKQKLKLPLLSEPIHTHKHLKWDTQHTFTNNQSVSL